VTVRFLMDYSAAATIEVVMAAFLLWIILFILCWPIALLALILYPFVWLLLLPFRLVGIAVHGVLGFSVPFSCSRSGSSAVRVPFEQLAPYCPGNSGVKRRKTSVLTHLQPLQGSFSCVFESPALCGKRCGKCICLIDISARNFVVTLKYLADISL